MRPMWFDSVAPAIGAMQPTGQVIRHRRIKCFGKGESDLEAMLPDLIRRGREPSVGITVSDATITLRITATGADEAACRAAMEPTVKTIYECLGSIAFGEEDDELEHSVARLLVEQGKTVAVLEWATGGLITQWLAAASSPDRRALLSGMTVTSVEELCRVLSISSTDAKSLAAGQSHDSNVAVIAAQTVLQLTGADFGLAVGAFPPVVDAPDARVHAAIATNGQTRRFHLPCASHPAIRQPRAAKQALNALRLTLLGQAPGE
jgi:nicotinamide-nucleotide amidase